MNIFYLSSVPELSAKAMTDKHIVKMVLESAQILSTVHQMHSVNPNEYLYRPTHKNHPCVKWAAENSTNYREMYNIFKALAKEYTNRYGKQHKSWSDLKDILAEVPDGVPFGFSTEPPMAMPDIYKGNDVASSYRLYYEKEKLKTDKDKSRYYRIFSSVVVTPR